MKKILDLAWKLLVIAGLSALILSLTNGATEPVIANREAEEFKQSFAVAYPEGKEFKTIEENVNANIQEVIEVSDGSNQVGYVFKATGQGGYGGDIGFIIGVDNTGVIKGFRVLTSSETKGYGSKAQEEPFEKGVIGVNISKGATAGNGNPDGGEIQAISGATRTTNAIASGINAVAIKLAELSDQIEPIAVKKPSYYPESYENLIKDVDKYQEVLNEEIYNEQFVRLVDAYKGDKLVGHIVQLVAKGFGGDIQILLGVDNDKKIVGYSVPSHNETQELGEVIETETYINNVIGKSLASRIKLKSEPKRDKDILLISGATITSMGMQDAFNFAVEGLKEYENLGEKSYKEINVQTLINAANYEKKKAEEAKKKEETAKNSSTDFAKMFSQIDSVEKIKEDMVKENVISINKAMKSGKEFGFVIGMKTQGFHGDIKSAFLIDSKGVIQDINNYSHEETEGLGANIDEDSYKATVIGKDLSKVETFKASTSKGDESIELISGATITSDAMAKMLTELAQIYKSIVK